MAYVVTAGAVTVETAIPGGRAMRDVFRGDPLPTDVPAEQVSRLLALGHIEEAAEGDEAAPPEGTVAAVLAWVGNDLDRAAAALSAEEAGQGRKTLVDALTALLGARN